MTHPEPVRAPVLLSSLLRVFTCLRVHAHSCTDGFVDVHMCVR